MTDQNTQIMTRLTKERENLFKSYEAVCAERDKLLAERVEYRKLGEQETECMYKALDERDDLRRQLSARDDHIEELITERDALREAREAAVTLWNDCGEELQTVCAERDALRAKVERMEKALESWEDAEAPPGTRERWELAKRLTEEVLK